MNTNRNVSFGSGIGSSAYEVEPAMFTPDGERSGVMRRLDHLKSRTSIVKSNVRSGVSNRMAKMQSSMRTNPVKWVGIAAGSGFVVGMLGRLLRARSEHRRHMPQLVVIESSC